VSEPVLEQGEIDALLNGVKALAGQAEPAPEPEGLRNYSFGNELPVLRGRMPMLDVVSERFVRLLRLSIYGILHRSADIVVGPVSLKKFGEYQQTLHLPSSLNMVHFKPLRGSSLIVLEPQLVGAIVENVFGGSGRNARIEGREFTATETRIARAVLDCVITDLKEAWSHVYPLDIEFIKAEMNPQFANIAGPAEIMLVSTFKIDIDGVGGELQLVMPFAMLEPLRAVLGAGTAGEHADPDERWSNALHNEILDATIELCANIGESKVQIAKLSELRAGDIIPLDFNGHATLLVDGSSLFTGRLGASRGQCAVQLQGNARVPHSNGPSALAVLQAQSRATGNPGRPE
jgi:flagellar motor switch protein FliM